MSKIFDYFWLIIPIMLVLAGIQAWYYFTHCANVKFVDMDGMCALLLYTSK